MVCLFSLQEKEKEALSWLKKTLELRKITYLKIESDTDLDYIREM
jgi:tRNA(Ser,Leu) C12 N-acetylase TAN1